MKFTLTLAYKEKMANGKYVCVQSWNVLGLRIASCPKRRSGNPPAPHKDSRLQCVLCISLSLAAETFNIFNSEVFLAFSPTEHGLNMERKYLSTEFYD